MTYTLFGAIWGIFSKCFFMFFNKKQSASLVPLSYFPAGCSTGCVPTTFISKESPRKRKTQGVKD